MSLSVPQLSTGCHQAGDTPISLHQHLEHAIQRKHYPTAIQLLNYLICQEPQNPDYYNHRGFIYYHCQQWSHARASYNQSLKLAPNQDRVYVNRAKCNMALGYWQEAVTDYDDAIAINPYNIDARLNQGVLFRTLKMYDDAITCFGLALFFGKLTANIYAERGRTYQLDGHWNQSIGDYQCALELLEESPNQFLESQIQIWLSELLA